MPYFDSFEINIVRALADQLVEAFARLEQGPLAPATMDELPQGQGVYQLFLDDTLVYVGKADSLQKRLREHYRKVLGRQNISVEHMNFKALFVHPNWTALAPEDSLIKHYRRSGTGECPWNGNGFGPHDPGRERETTNKAPDGFDAQYPIKAAWPCEWIKAGDHECNQLLRSLKKELPFLLRYQTTGSSARGHPEYNGRIIKVPQAGMSARAILKLIATNLPGWQATAFPSHMILYREQRAYAHGEAL